MFPDVRIGTIVAEVDACKLVNKISGARGESARAFQNERQDVEGWVYPRVICVDLLFFFCNPWGSGLICVAETGWIGYRDVHVGIPRGMADSEISTYHGY